MSLLNDLRSTNRLRHAEVTAEYDKALRECPPVSQALLAYLERMFSRKQIKPTEPTMQQELVYQAGIDRVLDFLRSQNERQEKEIRDTRTK